MSNVDDFGALNWVKDELDEAIRQARQDLERHVELSEEGALQSCAERLHQIAGVLQMVQVYGPGMLAEEMESVVRAMDEGHVRQQGDAAEALMLALIQLPDYLESLQGGEVDLPIIILPMLNDLRAVREAPLLTEAALFRPQIERNHAPERITGRPNPQLPDLVHRLRQKFHLGLLSWYRKNHVDKGWRHLLQVFDEIERHAGTQQVHRLFWLSGALVRGLMDGSVPSGFAIKQLFGKIDRQLKRIIDGGEESLVQSPPDDLLKNLLYYIAQAQSSDPRVVEVKKAFDLDTFLPSESRVDQGRRGLAGSNAELISSLNDAMHVELTRIKDVLDLFMRNERVDLAALEQLEKPMRQLADTLGMIGQGALRNRLLRQADRVKNYQQGDTKPEEFELMEMAGDILYIESSLSTLRNITPAEPEAEHDEKWGLKIPEGEFRNLLKQAVREAKVDIAKAKEAIIGFTESHGETRLLTSVHESLSRVQGALRVLEFNEPADILKQTIQYINVKLIDGQSVPDRQALNALADVISSMEYFLEALVDGVGDRREIIAIARTALDGLFKTEIGVGPETAAEPVEPIDEQPPETALDATREQVPVAEAVELEADSEPLVASADKPALDDIEPEILEIFIEEAKEELETIQTDLPAWKRNPDDKNALISFRRSFHTLKGSGRLVGAKVIGELSWSVENMLNRLIDETITVSPEMLDLLDDVMEALPELIESQEKSVATAVDVESLVHRAFELAEGRTPSMADSQPAAELPEQDDVSVPEIDTAQSEDTQDEIIEEIDISSFDLDGLEPGIDEQEAPETIQAALSDSELEIEIDTELLAVFANEAQTHLEVLEDFSRQSKAAEAMPQVSEEVLRACHTLHGSARMAGISYIANLARSVESYVKILSERQLPVNSEVLDLLDDAVTNTRHSLAWLRGEQPEEPDTDSYLARLANAQEALLDETPVEQPESRSEEAAAREVVMDEVFQETPDGLLDDELFSLEEDPELVEIFEEEARELLDVMLPAYGIWSEGNASEEKIQELRRGFHTMKGSSRMAGVAPIGDLSYTAEKVFNAFLEGGLETTPALTGLIGNTLDVLKIQVDEITGDDGVHWANRLAERLEAALQEARQPGPQETPTAAEPPRPDKPAIDEFPEIQIPESPAAASVAEEALSALPDSQEQQAISEPDAVSESAEPAALESVEELGEQVATEMAMPSSEAFEARETPQAIEETSSDEAVQAEDEKPAEAVEAATSALTEHDYENVELEPEDKTQFEIIEDPELLEVFVDEAKELLESLEASYQEWEKDQTNPQLLEEIKRTLHTFKGSARLAGVIPVGNLSHATESLFDHLGSGATDSVIRLVRQSLDMLANQIESAEVQHRVPTADSLIQRLDDLRLALLEAEDPSSLLLFDETSDSDFAASEPSELESDGDYAESYSFLHEDALFDVTEDPELVESFIEEAREFMERLESGFQQWAGNTADHSMIDSMQRSLHTLKGSARLAGITPVGDLSHAIETLMTAIADGEVEPSGTLVNLVRQSLDKLSDQLDDIVSSGNVTVAVPLMAQLDGAVSGLQQTDGDLIPAERPVTEGSVNKPEISDQTAAVVSLFAEKNLEASKPKENKQQVFKHSKDQVRVNSELMDRLVNNAGEVSIYRSRLEQQNNVLGFNLSELEQTVSRLHSQLRNLEIETEAQILYRWERDNERNEQDRTDFDPLELDRFSTMQQLSRALMETVNDLGNINESLADLQRETDTLLLQQSRIANDLQDGLLRTRMVPFMQLVPRLQRLVRQTADQLGKKAHLESFGAEGQMDRNILNRMIPVMEHLLRNAVSHGIEKPLDRVRANKDETGRISINIDRQANDIIISFADDGRGLDIEAIRRQAVSQGMIEEGAAVSDDDLIQCVLNPGFSTAQEITQIAGRGVGLDVVSSEIKQLGGTLDIDSQPGRGTSFTIRLPLTLAVSNALLVRAGEEIYAIPHGSVEGVVRIRQRDLQACYQGTQEGYTYMGRNYKVDYLGRMMGHDQAELPESVKWFPLLLVHAGEHHIALQVDELLGTRQIVVKSVGKQVGSVRWITGGTILADGQIALILDTGALVRMDATQAAVSPKEAVPVEKAADERIRVMVVDDSITVRKVTGRLLERNNMTVITAKDGVEAVAMLQEQVPDIMLLDIEMPRMDGFELARHIHNTVDYYGLPIIMISSRVGEKHRKRAFDLGVKRCLGKPYQEAELLENIYEVLQEAKV
jgi:chemosensory pili system protein ChpA (sensor histidine kinase/response regulator)